MKSASLMSIIEFMRSIIAHEMNIQPDRIDIDLPFHRLGLDSINSLYLLEKVEKRYNLEISPLYFWDYPTIRTLASQLYKEI